ncbi:MAG TPA: hypothetical protein VF702_08825 [Allosphingosinicella sp.]|jgi:hypothetical protein
MRRFLPLLPLAALAGCAGYASDYWGSERSIIQPQLARYGFSESEAECTGRRLEVSLGVWQMRQLERIARMMPQQRFGRSALAPVDLVEVANHVEDRRVRPEVAAAIEACGVTAPEAVAAAQAEAAAAAAAAAAPAAGAVQAPLWLNLGAAPSGQAISVNAASLSEEGGTRQAWFRLTDPGASGPGAGSYLLRVDCSARTINAMAFRRHGPDGSVAEERSYGPAGEGVAAVAGGTVMEIAYLALCT